MDALLDTLGGPEPEPEEDPTPVVEVSEVTPHSFFYPGFHTLPVETRVPFV